MPIWDSPSIGAGFSTYQDESFAASPWNIKNWAGAALPSWYKTPGAATAPGQSPTGMPMYPTPGTGTSGTPGTPGKMYGPGQGGVLPVPGGSYPVGASPNPSFMSAVNGLTTPGLVPDIARQSAEVSAGRGVAGSPTAASTAVRMSEQDYLQRLGLANTLLSGEANRNLPYQITPYQQRQLDLEQAAIFARYASHVGHSGTGGGGGGNMGRIGASPTANPFAGYTGFTDAFNRNAGNAGPFNSGPAGLGRTPDLTLDDMNEWFNWDGQDTGTGAGDTGTGDLSNWNWDYMPPEG